MNEEVKRENDALETPDQKRKRQRSLAAAFGLVFLAIVAGVAVIAYRFAVSAVRAADTATDAVRSRAEAELQNSITAATAAALKQERATQEAEAGDIM